ncbi:MAG: sodium:proton antiporter [Limisphaerales bacterium]
MNPSYSPNPWMVLPFVLLLACMAALPLACPQWWERHYAKVAVALSAVTVAYYVFGLPPAALATVAGTARDYIGFVVLIASLYVIAGGIHFQVNRPPTPGVNTLFLALGGLVSNVLGTTGAAVLLIRPWLRLNRQRAAAHHVVFFIFIVCNAGGCLTPMGDPPLLVGFLKGVPFWWVLRHCWPMWLCGMAFLLGVFYFIDRRHHAGVTALPAETSERWRFGGTWNLAFLAVVIAAMFLQNPFLGEALMLAAAAGSYLTTGRELREADQFSLRPMVEIAVLFFGIFATMMPALDLLARPTFREHLSVPLVYWSSGAMSAFLDSAPAYLAFFSAAKSGAAGGFDAGIVAALSVATVLFGAVTYIGNAPNLMVKSIADHQKIRTPSFLGYLFKWAVPVMLPLLLILWMVFFR